MIVGSDMSVALRQLDPHRLDLAGEEDLSRLFGNHATTGESANCRKPLRDKHPTFGPARDRKGADTRSGAPGRAAGRPAAGRRLDGEGSERSTPAC